jgi:hypothetical protein
LQQSIDAAAAVEVRSEADAAAAVEVRSEADAAHAEKVKLAVAKRELRKQQLKDWRRKLKEEEAALRAEADACGEAGVEMDAGRAARLATILEAKERHSKQVSEWKLKDQAQEKEAHAQCYEEIRPSALAYQKRKCEEEKELCAEAAPCICEFKMHMRSRRPRSQHCPLTCRRRRNSSRDSPSFGVRRIARSWKHGQCASSLVCLIDASR